MRHPSNRAERRDARELARNRRRTYIYIWHLCTGDHEENLGWNRGGKQYFACGNRCLHSMADRHQAHRTVKRLRRTDWLRASDSPAFDAW
jgi:hypothetical protein